MEKTLFKTCFLSGILVELGDTSRFSWELGVRSARQCFLTCGDARPHGWAVLKIGNFWGPRLWCIPTVWDSCVPRLGSTVKKISRLFKFFGVNYFVFGFFVRNSISWDCTIIL